MLKKILYALFHLKISSISATSTIYAYLIFKWKREGNKGRHGLEQGKALVSFTLQTHVSNWLLAVSISMSCQSTKLSHSQSNHLSHPALLL